MTKFLLLTFLTLTNLINGQTVCNPSISIPMDIFYPYTTSVLPTFSVSSNSLVYLCGPNTVLYDTLGSGKCHAAYVNSGCTLIFKQNPSVCGGPHPIYLKSNSTLILKAGGQVWIYYEPLTTIINLAGVPVFSTSCASINFPIVNCANGLNKNNKKEIIFEIFPNPTSSKININVLNPDEQFADIRITSQCEDVVFENKKWQISDKEIPIEKISNGYYFIQIKTKLGQQIEKLIVIH